MKILAIRGKNLASISTSFEISLDQGLLGHSGLFAITGDTGAGKSTILDAMTLAIYGKAVRFDGIGKADTRNDRHSEKLKKELDGMVHDDMGFPEKKEKTDRP